MSVEQTDVVDFISTNRESGNVVLTIADDLAWSPDVRHIEILQEKINTYLAFVESGEILDSYPDSRGRNVEISLVLRFEIDAEGERFIEHVRKVLDRAGITFTVRLFKG